MKTPAKARVAPKSKPGKRADHRDAIVANARKRKSAPSEDVLVNAPVEAPTVVPTASSEHVKLVRDSFTMPRDDFDLIAKLKARALEFKRPTKKSELLRAGLQRLAALDEAQLRAALAALRPLQAGRPKKKR